MVMDVADMVQGQTETDKDIHGNKFRLLNESVHISSRSVPVNSDGAELSPIIKTQQQQQFPSLFCI